MTVARDLTKEGSILVLANLPDVRTDSEETNVEFRIVVNSVPVGFANSGSCTRFYGPTGTTCPAINLHGVAHNITPAGTNTSDLHATVQYRIQTGGNMSICTVSPPPPPSRPPPPPPYVFGWSGTNGVPTPPASEKWCGQSNAAMSMYTLNMGVAVQDSIAGVSGWGEESGAAGGWRWATTTLAACQQAAVALSGHDLKEVWRGSNGLCFPSTSRCTSGTHEPGGAGLKYHYTTRNVPWNDPRSPSSELWCAHSNDGMYHDGSGLAQHSIAGVSDWGMDADHDGGYRWMTTTLTACQEAAIALSGDNLAEIWRNTTDPAGAGWCFPSTSRCSNGAAEPGGPGRKYLHYPTNYTIPEPRSGTRMRQLTTFATAAKEFVTKDWSTSSTTVVANSNWAALPTPMTISFEVPLDSGGRDEGSSALVFASLSRMQAADEGTVVQLQLLVDSVEVGSWQSSSTGGYTGGTSSSTNPSHYSGGTSSFTDPSLHAVVEGLTSGTHVAEVEYRLPAGAGTIIFPADEHPAGIQRTGTQHRRLTVMSNRAEPYNETAGTYGETARFIGCWDPLGAALPFRIALASTKNPSRTYLGAASDGSMTSLSPTAGGNQQWLVNTSGVNAQGRATYHIHLDTKVSVSQERTYLDSSGDGTMVSSWFAPGTRQEWDIEDHGWYSLIKAADSAQTRTYLGASSDGFIINLWTAAKARQRWVLTCVSGEPVIVKGCWANVDTTTTTLQSLSSTVTANRSYLTLSHDGTSASLWSTVGAKQRWVVTDMGTYATIGIDVNSTSRKYLGSNADGTALTLWSATTAA